MEICRAYELDLEGYTIQTGIEYKVVESKLFSNAHFHGLHVSDKATKYQKLKQGEKRIQGPKATLTFKSINPEDEDKELANIVARELARIS